MPRASAIHPSAGEPRDDDAASFVIAGRKLAAPRIAPGLHVVATPIGALADITIRALETLAGSDLILCEDTRVTRKLVSHYGIATPLAAYHEHNASEMRPKVLARLEQGGRVALVSDAGTPLVSDPGFKLVRDAIAAGAAVTTAPGPSATLAALVLSGLPTDRFFFEGFLPAKRQARRARIAELARIPATLVLFESGPRVAEAMADLAEILGERPAALARELTKRFEEVRRGALGELAAQLGQEPDPKGEIALVIAAPEEDATGADEVDALLRAALARTSLKEAVAEVALASGVARREVYARALELRDEA